MLSRWDPFRDMLNLRSQLDRMLENSLDQSTQDWQPEAWGFPLDVSEKEDAFVVKASLPGIDPKELDITFNNDTLIIQGEIKPEEAEEGTRYHLRERSYGRFTRSLRLPTRINAGNIDANYDAGVLTLHLPKAEEVKPKRIQIHTGQKQHAIEGEFKKNGGKG